MELLVPVFHGLLRLLYCYVDVFTPPMYVDESLGSAISCSSLKLAVSCPSDLRIASQWIGVQLRGALHGLCDLVLLACWRLMV